MPPPALCLALCQNLPPLQQRSSGRDLCPHCGAQSWSSRERARSLLMAADSSPEGPEVIVGSGSSPYGPEVIAGSRSLHHAAGLAAAPEQPATSISSAPEVTAHVAAEGLPAPQLPQFAGWHVVQTTDEDKLAASHPQKHPQHQHSAALPRLLSRLAPQAHPGSSWAHACADLEEQN